MVHFSSISKNGEKYSYVKMIILPWSESKFNNKKSCFREDTCIVQKERKSGMLTSEKDNESFLEWPSKRPLTLIL